MQRINKYLPSRIHTSFAYTTTVVFRSSHTQPTHSSSEVTSQSSSSNNNTNNHAYMKWIQKFRLDRIPKFTDSITSLSNASFSILVTQLLPNVAARLVEPIKASLPTLASAGNGLQSLRKLPLLRRSARSSTDTDDTPELTYVPTSFNRSLISRSPSLVHPYQPTFWMRSAHAQTILGTVLRRRPNILYSRELLKLVSDGGELCLDWDSGRAGDKKGRIEPALGIPTPLKPSLSNQPILFLLPGLTGGSNSRYILQTIEASRALGWKSVCFNFRGIGVPMVTPRPSTGVDISDVLEAFRHVHACYPHAPMLAAGFSMGANMLVKSLGTLGGATYASTGLVGSAAVSCAFDFLRLARNLHERPVNKLIYSRFLTAQLKANYLKSPVWKHLAQQVDTLDLAHALRSETIWELDDRFTKHLYGIPQVERYYDEQSSKYRVHQVATPLLCLNAKDDPFEGEIPVDAIAANPHIILAQTKRGGHVAWTSGANPLAQGSSWMIHTTLEYLAATLAIHTEQSALQQQQQPAAPATLISPYAADEAHSEL